MNNSNILKIATNGKSTSLNGVIPYLFRSLPKCFRRAVEARSRRYRYLEKKLSQSKVGERRTIGCIRNSTTNSVYD